MVLALMYVFINLFQCLPLPKEEKQIEGTNRITTVKLTTKYDDDGRPIYTFNITLDNEVKKVVDIVAYINKKDSDGRLRIYGQFGFGRNPNSGYHYCGEGKRYFTSEHSNGCVIEDESNILIRFYADDNDDSEKDIFSSWIRKPGEVDLVRDDS